MYPRTPDSLIALGGPTRQITTPSGISLYYQSEPKRLYRVGNQVVPSVTTILDVLNKPALVWWAMKIGIEGAKKLQEKVSCDPDTRDCNILDWNVDSITDNLTKEKLTVNHVKESAGRRGDAAHSIFERWAAGNALDSGLEYTQEELGYIQGLVSFLEDTKGHINPLQSEVMVGSVEHEFGGRYDLVADLDEARVVIKANKKPKYETYSGRFLIDLKTTKYVYDIQHLQLAAYEGASRECGYGYTDYRAVLRVTHDGRYEFVVTDRPCWDAFLAVKDCYNAMKYMKGKYVPEEFA